MQAWIYKFQYFVEDYSKTHGIPDKQYFSFND